jgi:hypothetical protein
MNLCVCVGMYVYLYVCMYVFMYVYMYFIYASKVFLTKLHTPITHTALRYSQLSLNANCSGFERRKNKGYEPQDLEDLNMCRVAELFCFVLEIIPNSVLIPSINCYSLILTVCYKNEKIFYCSQDKINFYKPSSIFITV